MTVPRTEIQKIEEDIHRLEELKQSGTMPADLADASIEGLKIKRATYYADLKGSGAIAEDHSQAVGERGILANGGNEDNIFNTGDNVEINVGTQPRAKKGSLRESYMSYVLEQVSPLALSGVVRQSASEAETRMNLSAVYTALLTQNKVPEEFVRDRDALGLVKWLRQNERISVVESINQYDHMVLLGDPGSGKSTFVNFVVLSMAGEALGREDANLKVLTQPLPLEPDEASHTKNEDKKPEPQHWDHGALIPARIILRDFTARGLPLAGELASAEHIWKFIENELKAASLSEFAPLLKKEWHDQGGLIMFDGLDEVPEAENLRDQIRGAIESFSAAFPRCRVLVTSRTYAYQKQDWKLKGFTETVLTPFTKGQISQYVERWYAHIARLRSQNEEDAQGKAELLKHAIFSSERLLGLAERPLLLTLMTSLHAWRGGTLPDKREELYANAVDLLLDWWESQRVVRDTKGNISVIQPSLAEWLKVDRKKVRDLLNQLAFDAHARQSELVGTADIPENALIAGLMNLSQNPDVKPARLIEYLRDRAGLLVSRGVGVYTFPHRTFQEYLAACYLTDHDYPELISKLTRNDPNRWREVALLAGAKAASGTAVFALWSLVDALSPERDSSNGEAGYWGAQIAGQAVIEITDFEKVSESTQMKIDRLRNRLLDIMEGNRLPAVERVQAGNNLAVLGDPRFNADQWYFPNNDTLGFTQIPAGTFLMGSNNSDDEKPLHEVILPDYWMAKYPVTVAQFRAFAEAIKFPYKYWHYNNTPTRPIVFVNWNEALEFTKWADKEICKYAKRQIKSGVKNLLLQRLAERKLHITLPSEAEWEKSAHNTLRVTDDGRSFPWNGKFDPDKANTREALIDDVSPVGCFPTGASPDGLLDLSGNVWEWTRSNFKKYPYKTGDGREDLKSKNIRVLRGGSFRLPSIYAQYSPRDCLDPVGRDKDVGFRLVISPFFPS